MPVDLARRRRLPCLVQDQLDLRRPREGRLSRQQLVQRHAQTVLVARRHRVSRRLFRRHVRRGPHHRAFLGELLVALRPRRQAEVHQQRFPLFIEHDVGRLHVAVDDALAVRVRQRLREAPHDLDGLPDVPPLPFGLFRQGRGEGSARDEGRCDVILRAVLAGVVDGDDVGVAQVGGSLGLAQEALDALLGVEHVRLGHLQRHFPVQLGIIRLVDDAERALAEPLAHFKAADANHVGRRRVGDRHRCVGDGRRGIRGLRPRGRRQAKHLGAVRAAQGTRTRFLADAEELATGGIGTTDDGHGGSAAKEVNSRRASGLVRKFLS